MNNITLATFEERDFAEHLHKRLSEAGFHSELVDETGFQKRRLVSEPHAAFHVNVPRVEMETALQRLREWNEKDGAMSAALHCPQCQSSCVEYPQIARNFYTPEFVTVLLALGILEKKFYCRDCHHTWSNEVHPAVERDILGWAKVH